MRERKLTKCHDTKPNKANNRPKAVGTLFKPVCTYYTISRLRFNKSLCIQCIHMHIYIYIIYYSNCTHIFMCVIISIIIQLYKDMCSYRNINIGLE